MKCLMCDNDAKYLTSKKKFSKFCSKTCSCRYTCSNPSRIDKIKKTKLERYGDENYCNLSKSNQTKLAKYGNLNNIEKTKETNRQKYGVDFLFQTKEFKEKHSNIDRNLIKNKQTCLERYGYENQFQRPEIQQQLKQKLTEKYGVDNPQKNSEIRERTLKTFYKNHPQYDINIDELKELYKKESSRALAPKYNVSDVTIRNRLKAAGVQTIPRRQISLFETEIYEYIKSVYSGPVIKKDRSVLKPKEIDIYLPDLKLAIEANGSYYHTTKFLNKYHHRDKSIACEAQGIQLLHIFDYQWKNEQDKIKSFLSNKIGKSTKIYARKCTVAKTTKEEAKEFYSKNHLQGFANSKINLGLYYENKLISLMSFSKSRFDKNYEYELTHFCSLLYTQVLGAASKLFAAFVKKYSPNSIMTYCNISYSLGEVYSKLGFKRIRTIQPNYVYFRHDKIYSKLLFKKKYFEQTEKTEEQIAAELKYYKIYDSGKYIYEWSKPL